MSMYVKLKRFLCDSKIRFGYLNKLGFYRHLSDEEFLKKAFKVNLGYVLNLEKPQTFNEKMQWLKLYDRNPIYTQMVDKYEVKKYVANRIGEEYIIPTLGVWDKFEDINFDELPEQFVLKCTHDSGGLVICRNKNTLDINAAREKINSCLKVNYYDMWREWPYKDVEPRIIAEKYMDSNELKNNEETPTEGLVDYKFYCFNGLPQFLYISEGLENHATASISFLTLDWEFAPYKRSDYKGFTNLPSKPSKFEKMIEVAKILSKGHSFIRVDLYQIGEKIYFSELTFSPCGGFMPFVESQHDLEIGQMLILNSAEK